jgi:uncharacterized protein (DUF4415 family)
MSKRRAEKAAPLEPLTDADGEVRELTEADFAEMRPAYEVLPPELVALMRRHRGERGAQKAPTKKLVSIRLDQDVIERVKQDGAGWQTRINDILRDALFKRTG